MVTDLQWLRGRENQLACFLALSLPYVFVGLADYFFVARHYYDLASGYTLHYWIANSLGWLYAEPDPLFLGSGMTLRAHYPAIPESEIGAILLTVLGGEVREIETMVALGIGAERCDYVRRCMVGRSVGRPCGVAMAAFGCGRVPGGGAARHDARLDAIPSLRDADAAGGGCAVFAGRA